MEISLTTISLKTMKNDNRPKVDQIIHVYGQQCRIVKVHPFGTVDVVAVSGKHAFRVTGLNFL